MDDRNLPVRQLLVVLVGLGALVLGLRWWAGTGTAPAGLPGDVPGCDGGNCVSSFTSARGGGAIPPLDCTFDDARAAVLDLDRTAEVTSSTDDGVRRVHLTATTRWIAFVDDLVLAGPPEGPVDVWSGSRLGASDLGVNGRRVEAIRAACEG